MNLAFIFAILFILAFVLVLILNKEGRRLRYELDVFQKREKERREILRNLLEREEALAKTRTDFVNLAAHQLKTPLAALKWSLKLLLEGDFGKLSGEQEEFVKKSYEVNERMIKLVSDLLSAARIEEGKFEYEFKELEPVSFAKSLTESYRPLAESRRISLNFEVEGEKFPSLSADEEKLSLVLSNLIENSLNYTKPGGKIFVRLLREGNSVKFKVEDTGVGIPAEEQEKVFLKFFRASNAVKLETEGTGLGLFIAKSIAEKHGGRLSFKSKEGKGTTFTLTLPLGRRLISEKETA